MNKYSVKILLYKWLFPKIFKKIAPDRIPRTGEKGRKVNCYSVHFDQEKSPYFLAMSYSNSILTGYGWNGSMYDIDLEIKLSDLGKYDFNIIHFYGLNEITYENIYDLAWHYITKLIYVKIHFNRFISSVTQYFFNKKKFFTKKRMELLLILLDWQFEREKSGFSTIDLMTKLYTIKWIYHPSGKDQERKLKIYLESLESSGEIKKTSDGYLVTGRAISTLERYEEEERRHIQAVKLQRGMLLLTIIIIIVSLLQSDLIKLPTLINLSND